MFVLLWWDDDLCTLNWVIAQLEAGIYLMILTLLFMVRQHLLVLAVHLNLTSLAWGASPGSGTPGGGGLLEGANQVSTTYLLTTRMGTTLGKDILEVQHDLKGLDTVCSGGSCSSLGVFTTMIGDI
jgi:hypothetical protein